MRHIILQFAIVLTLALGSYAGEITGRVVDIDGNPLRAVTVMSDVSGKGTACDDAGNFRLDDTEVTRLTFSSVGYASVQYRVADMPGVVVLDRIYYETQGIIIRADRAEEGITPIAFDNITSEDIQRDYTVGEFPLLVASTPNLYAFSDGGGALGYSYMRIRGFDDKRVSTYINGVPLNDPEDQATYFVDLPDFAASVSDIQVQRGVGNSLYGDGSFGGSINIVTNVIARPRRTVLTAGYGEYTSGGVSISDIYKQSFEYSSGLVDGRWSYSGRYSKQKSGGYRQGSWYDGWAYSFSVARLDHNMTTELHVYGGPMRMHLAYYGVPRSVLEQYPTSNPLTYSNETDNFNQPHYQLHNVWRISDNKSLSNTFYYIRGKGYYEQFKQGRDFYSYGIPGTIVDVDPSTGEPYESGNLVRQQWVEKNQIGLNPRYDVTHDRGRHSIGGSYYYFESDHWGQVVWAEHLNGMVDPRHKYYQYFGTKHVASFFGQEYYRLDDRFSVQLTGQLRYQSYKFDQVRSGAFKGYDYSLDWFFFSPRVGLNYKHSDQLSLFTNFSVASRTPTDAAIYDANDPWTMPSLEIESVQLATSGDTVSVEFGDPTANAERVFDIEIGGQFRTAGYAFGLNLFWMDFRDEIIPEGKLSENTGLPITVNADRSVHSGIELSGTFKAGRNLVLSSNFAYNHNRIKKYVGEITVYPNAGEPYQVKHDFAGNTIAGFPEVLGNFVADFTTDRLRLTGRVRLAGKQFVGLFNSDSLAIDGHTTFALSGSYKMPSLLGVGDLTLQLRVDNLFDKKYEAAGYGWTYGLSQSSVSTVQLIHEGEYFVAAERSFYAQLQLEMF